MTDLASNLLAGSVGTIVTVSGLLLWLFSEKVSVRAAQRQRRMFGTQVAGRFSSQANVRLAAAGWLVVGAVIVLFALMGRFQVSV
jgi:hypothetical protein